MEAGAQREATPPMPQEETVDMEVGEETPPMPQEETPVDGVRAKDTEHETALAAAVELLVTRSAVYAPEACVDYDKLVRLFGCQLIDSALVHRIEHLTSRPPHRFLRRGIFFAHRDLESILDLHEAGGKFYLYTGMEPSSEPLQLGQLIPFMFTKYLQDAFKVPVVIQLCDDATYLWNDLSIAESQRLAHENAKDIIACGFDIERTFIFTNINYTRGAFYESILEVAKCVTCEYTREKYGGCSEDNIGKVGFPPVAVAPSLPSSFPHLFSRNDPPQCLITCAIYQDPCLGIARDVASEIGFQKPSLIESKIFPALQGPSSKKSASNPNPAIYVTDNPKQIKTKVNKYAFSGGQSSVELHRKHGANLDVDVSIKYLEFFLEDDDEFERIKKEYKEGRMLTGEVKQCLIRAISEMVSRHQRARAQVTDEMVDAFMAVRRLPNMFG